VLLDDLFGLLGKCGAGSKLVLMDACRNEMEVKGSKRSLDLNSVRIPKGVAALFSCSSGQRSFEADSLKHGVFFHFVLKGLGGQASNEDNEVTWARLTAYVTRQVEREVPRIIRGGARQKPAFISHLEGDPVLLLAKGKTPKKPEREPIEKALPKEIENSIGMKLKLIPAGTFDMGAAEGEQDADKDDEKQHRVTITKPFYMGIHEVTQKQFRQVLRFNPSHFSRAGKGKEKVKGLDTDDFPVENVSWEQAKRFCEEMSKLETEKKAGRTYGLPTEAQWEYACRAGTRSAFSFGKNSSSTEANFSGAFKRTRKVGSYAANALGLYDMHGNVAEWCSDWYKRGFYGKDSREDPKGPARGEERVFRGGGWSDPAALCRSASRDRKRPGSQDNILGFRVVLVPPAK
jgi:formylglycine-generating enzyme required for sulfatase activity